MAAERRESMKVAFDKALSAATRWPQIKVVDLSFAAPVEKIKSFPRTNQELSLFCLIKTKHSAGLEIRTL